MQMQVSQLMLLVSLIFSFINIAFTLEGICYQMKKCTLTVKTLVSIPDNYCSTKMFPGEKVYDEEVALDELCDNRSSADWLQGGAGSAKEICRSSDGVTCSQASELVDGKKRRKLSIWRATKDCRKYWTGLHVLKSKNVGQPAGNAMGYRCYLNYHVVCAGKVGHDKTVTCKSKHKAT